MKFMTQEIIATRRTPAEDALSRAETSSVKEISTTWNKYRQVKLPEDVVKLEAINALKNRLDKNGPA